MKLSYSSLDDHLASGDPAPVYVLTGTQDLLRELAGKEIQRAALGDAEAAFNFDKFDGETVPIEHVIESCNMFPLMATRRFVMVRRAGKFLQESNSQRLISYLEDPSPQTTLVLELDKSPDARRKAWKQLEKRVIVIQCEPLKEREVEGWVGEQARLHGLNLSREEVRYLVGEFGSDLRRHVSELEKISLFAGDESIGTEELATVLGRGKAQSIFRFTDAVANRDAPVALTQLGRLLEEGESPLPILALLDRTVGQLLIAKELRRRKKRSGDAASLLGVPGWKVEQLLRQSDSFSGDQLSEALGKVAQVDLTMKTTGVPARLLLESLVVLLCGAGPDRRRVKR